MYLKHTNPHRSDDTPRSHQGYKTSSSGPATGLRDTPLNSHWQAREIKAGPAPTAYSLSGEGKLFRRKAGRLPLTACSLLFKDVREKPLYLWGQETPVNAFCHQQVRSSVSLKVWSDSSGTHARFLKQVEVNLESDS